MMGFWLFIFMVEDEYLVKIQCPLFVNLPQKNHSFGQSAESFEQRYTTLVWDQHFLKWTVCWAFYDGKSVN